MTNISNDTQADALQSDTISSLIEIHAKLDRIIRTNEVLERAAEKTNQELITISSDAMNLKNVVEKFNETPFKPCTSQELPTYSATLKTSKNTMINIPSLAIYPLNTQDLTITEKYIMYNINPVKL